VVSYLAFLASIIYIYNLLFFFPYLYNIFIKFFGFVVVFVVVGPRDAAATPARHDLPNALTSRVRTETTANSAVATFGLARCLSVSVTVAVAAVAAVDVDVDVKCSQSADSKQAGQTERGSIKGIATCTWHELNSHNNNNNAKNNNR